MIRRALLATLLGLATVAAVGATPAYARACMLDYSCVTTWYSDNTYTTVVGAKYESCVGDSYMWGVRSGHPTFVETPC
jgi:hypothetical protein